ncbi:ABC-three component system protein [Sphingobacterium sp. NGMCC 1.201703]|uniref:ABC-three component system protein n=1 Tax=Sphingobacterium sp. NGMCC 1.201703 TaxID=3388657 RepID=UPI0039FD959A
MTKEKDFPNPEKKGPLTNNDILFGESIIPIDRLKIFSPDDFEDFTREWVVGYLMTTGEYTDCKKCSGSGDKGRDVIAKKEGGKWDNYQCKHYDAALTPSDIWKELIKLIYYTKQKEFKLPERYYFVSPHGAGPKLNKYMENPEDLKENLLANWDNHNSIGTNLTIALDEGMLEYINTIAFDIFDCVDPQVLIDQHQRTVYFPARFGGGLIKKRALDNSIPNAIQQYEQVYTNQLFKVYTEYKGDEFSTIGHLEKDAKIAGHFQRQRVGFFSADSLNQYSRDTLPPDQDYFHDLKQQFYLGIVDTVESDHANSYVRVNETIKAANSLNITSSPLVSHLRIEDRIGICHHLINDLKIKWIE